MTEISPFVRLGFVERGEEVCIRVDGVTVKAFAGETVASAMLAAGLTGCQSHDGRPLGVFCNIGQCQGCLVTIDGYGGVRACQTPVAPGLNIKTREVRKRGPQ